MIEQQNEEATGRISVLTPEELEVIRRASAPTLRDLQMGGGEEATREALEGSPTSRGSEASSQAK